MSLQDVRFNLENPTIARSKRYIRIRIFISDFMRSILGRIGRVGNRFIGVVTTVVTVTVPIMLLTDRLILIYEIDSSHSVGFYCGR